jgi:hypothetical protein
LSLPKPVKGAILASEPLAIWRMSVEMSPRGVVTGHGHL